MSYDQNILIQNREILPKLAEVLDLIFKKTKRGAAFQDGYFSSIHHLKKSVLPGKYSVGIINECLLNHRFNEAVKMLWILCQDRCSFDLVLYKGIMVALDNLISSDEIETTKELTSNIRKLRSVNKLELQLEYLIYVLKKDTEGTEDLYYLEGKKKRQNRLKIIPCIEQLYSAYTSLISYITWATFSQNDQLSKTNREFAFTIIHSFKQLVSNPGIWDIFVLKLIEMLEYYEQYDELEDILKKYVELNPNHVNAYIYLCVHLHKHNADPEIFIHYAKILSNLCPSDERLLLLVQKWDQLGKNLKKCLKILFAFLDYPINGRQLLGWQLLSVHLCKATLSKESSLLEFINSSWQKRSSSWIYMHFKLSNISTDPFELIKWKVKVLSVVQPDHEYIENANKKLLDYKDHLLQNGDSSPSSANFRSLCNLDVTRYS